MDFRNFWHEGKLLVCVQNPYFEFPKNKRCLTYNSIRSTFTNRFRMKRSKALSKSKSINCQSTITKREVSHFLTSNRIHTMKDGKTSLSNWPSMQVSTSCSKSGSSLKTNKAAKSHRMSSILSDHSMKSS